MSGVEILTIEEVATKNAFNWVAFLITAGVILLVFIVFGIIMSIRYDNWVNLSIGIIAGIIFGALFGSLIGSGLSVPSEYETQYKLTISDEVLMNEFIDKYEIIEQSGKLYTVRERKE